MKLLGRFNATGYSQAERRNVKMAISVTAHTTSRSPAAGGSAVTVSNTLTATLSEQVQNEIYRSGRWPYVRYRTELIIAR